MAKGESPAGGSPSPLERVHLKLVETEEERALLDRFVRQHHSYARSYRSAGEGIDWLAMLDGEVVAVVGIGDPIHPAPQGLLEHLGISKAQYGQNLMHFAYHWRFCVARRIPNLGSRVLRLMREAAPGEWRRKYGKELKVLMTLVLAPKGGEVYRADNWEEVRRPGAKKLLFVYVLDRAWLSSLAKMK